MYPVRGNVLIRNSCRRLQTQGGFYPHGSVTGVKYVALFAMKANITVVLALLSPAIALKVLLLTRSSAAVESAHPAASMLR